MENKSTSVKEKVLSGVQLYASVTLAFLALLLLVTTFEVMYSRMANGAGQVPLSALLIAWFNDLILWVNYNIGMGLIYVLVHFLNPRLAKILFVLVASLHLFIQLLLVGYFASASVPLGADLFGYSNEDIRQTLGASGTLTVFNTVLLLAASVSIVVTLLWLPKRFTLPRSLAYALPFISLLVLLSGYTRKPYTQRAATDFTNNLVVNKSDFFYRESFRHFFPEEAETDIYADGYLGVYSSETSDIKLKSVKYLDDEQYPFLHADSTEEVLSPFFNRSTTAPNIVIIMVEGLGRAFTNEGAALGNFTPFLDSLAGKSLYFSNFLSAGGRTFAALPSLLASLPYGDNGFLELGNRMPRHLSLLNLLKSSGYHTSFYYGGDSHFDNMDTFLKKNRIDELHDGKTFPSGYQKLPALNGFTWGYNDAELYRRYFESLPSDEKRPQLSVLLTVSSHDPFLINNQQRYLAMFNDRLAALGLNNETARSYQSYKNEYSSIVYTDEALKGFFERYRKREDFNNTIFIITGDHRMPEIPMRTKIDRYHVPLIIYSPLLKRTAKFESVSSHLDLAPSLLAFLSKEYGINRPTLCSWVGQGLDTTRAFRNIHSTPLIQTKTTITDFVEGDYHLNNGILYKLSNNMNVEAVVDQGRLTRISGSFDAFKRRNALFMKGRRLIPDSLYQKYAGQ